MLEFAAATNTSLVFGLTFSADVNSSHTAALLRHVAGGKHAVYGYEYGNEQVKVERAAEQFGVLQRMLPGLYSAPPESKPVPKLIGPDWFNTGEKGEPRVRSPAPPRPLHLACVLTAGRIRRPPP